MSPIATYRHRISDPRWGYQHPSDDSMAVIASRLIEEGDPLRIGRDGMGES